MVFVITPVFNMTSWLILVQLHWDQAALPDPTSKINKGAVCEMAINYSLFTPTQS